MLRWIEQSQGIQMMEKGEEFREDTDNGEKEI